MPFVQGKCENCGGILTVDPNLKAANCPFCGAAYVIQDAINYCNTTVNVGNVETMHADVVNMYDESSSEGKIKAANAYLKLGKFEQAYFDFVRVTELAPQNYLGWLGLIESSTNNYTKRIRSTRELCKLKDYSKYVLTLAPIGKGEVILKKFICYMESEEKYNDLEKKQIDLELTDPETEFNQLEDIICSLQSDMSKYESKIAALKLHNNNGVGTFFVIAGIIISVIVINIFINDFVLIKSTIELFAPVIITGILFFSIGIVLKTKSKKHAHEIVKLTAKQKELERQAMAKVNEKESINNEIMKIREKYKVYD